VRGTRQRRHADQDLLRFIPAGAGNTASWPTWCRPRTVHPRGCGEHGMGVATSPNIAGSSPRVRGTHHNPSPEYLRARFIPAGAGNTRDMAVPLGWRAVHPRGCGEHVEFTPTAGTLTGSSPRVRGTRTSRRYTAPLAAVHPRGCGEHPFKVAHLHNDSGSSPRVRGTRPGSPRCPAGCRFIPAGAGNTSYDDALRIFQTVHPRGCGEHGIRSGSGNA